MQRERYKQLSADKKEATLLQRWTKYFQSRGRALSNISLADNNRNASVKAVLGIPQQATLTIREPSHLTNNANNSPIGDPATTFGKVKNIIEYFCIFEKGSTSNPLSEHHNPMEVTRKSTGNKLPIVRCWNIKQLPKTPSILEKEDNTNVEIDEIKEYQLARWVSPPEATWCLFAFPISEMSPTVYHLQLHLKGLLFINSFSVLNINLSSVLCC